MKQYMDLCQEAGTGPSGLITKCNRVITALAYYKLEKTRSTDTARHTEISMACERISMWKNTYAKRRKETNVLAMDEERESGRYDYKELTKVMENEEMWRTFDAIANKASKVPLNTRQQQQWSQLCCCSEVLSGHQQLLVRRW